MQEYIQKAIELGVDVYGFSEHAPMKNFEDGYRLLLKDKKYYENSIEDLQQNFAKDIKILKAYEVDFIKGDYLLDDILQADVDYLVGSVHYLGSWGFDNPEFIKEYEKKDIDLIWSDYFQGVKDMAQTGKFQIVGHLDLMKVFKFLPKKDIRILANDAIQAIKQSGMAVELNPAGLRKPIGEQYPSKELLEICFENDIPITFGSDAHSVEQVGYGYEQVKLLAKQIGYTKCVYFEKKEKQFVSF